MRRPGFQVPGFHLRGWKSGSGFSPGVRGKGRGGQDPEIKARWSPLRSNHATTVDAVSCERSKLSSSRILPGPKAAADANIAGSLGVLIPGD